MNEHEAGSHIPPLATSLWGDVALGKTLTLDEAMDIILYWYMSDFLVAPLEISLYESLGSNLYFAVRA